MEELRKMENDSNNNQLSRRGFLGVGSAALAAVAGGLSVSSALAQEGQQAGNARTDRSATDPGPANNPLDAQNPDSGWPPATDSKSLVQTFKYPFSFANKRTYKGGWSREVTVRELPVSKTMAGVNMRLTAGGVRELHWHTADEWAIVLYGSARITAIDRNGKSFVADVKKNDLWYFPTGIPHSIQGSSPMALNSCWCSTTETFRSQTRCCLATRWRTYRAKCSQKISALPRRPLRTSPETNCSFSRRTFRGPSRLIRKWLPERSALLQRILPSARWKCHRRSAPPAARCVLLIRASS